ncbi:MAG: helix-turn-helix domain-containing protein [Bryobacteraceae bacterium]|nr:helix-turn-helix domain-containing protein [Bryobacteraceae bacterium]
MDAYLSSLPYDRVTVIRTWATIESYRCLMPATASSAERQLFLSNVETLLRIGMTAFSGVKPSSAQQPLGSAILTIQEASDLLRVAPRTLRLWAELGEIPAVKVGRQWRFRLRDVEEWLVRPITPRRNR